MSPFDNSSDYTGSMPDYPCLQCTRSKHCTMTVSNVGGPCPMFTTSKTGYFEGSSTVKKNYIKRNHHKKRSYHRGKF